MRIAIVGGGPAGLVAALAARRRGLDAVVFEQARDFRRVGAGIALHSNGLRALAALDVLDRLRPHIRPFQTLAIERVGVGTLYTVDVGALSVPHNQVSILLRYQLQQTLLEAVVAAGVPVSFERACAGAVWRGGRIDLRFGDALEQGFDAVVAADGVHSVLRASVAPDTRERPLGWASVRGVVELPRAENRVREIWGPEGRLFGIAPLPGNQTYWYATAPLGRWREILDAGAVSAWIDGWRAFGADVMAILRAVPDWQSVSYDEIREVRARPWYRRAIFLVGDAAHAMAPNLGQGANSAMVDAFVLVEMLADAERSGGDLDAVGQGYQDLRRRFVTRIQTASRWGGALPHWRAAPLRFLADAMMRAQDRAPWLKRSASLIGVGYNANEARYLDPPPPQRKRTTDLAD
jgi:2-polyprenyl-6-methoxyphenol hydroxylase-like FAD-dependent oxidoreductase